MPDILLLPISWRLHARPTHYLEIGWPGGRVYPLYEYFNASIGTCARVGPGRKSRQLELGSAGWNSPMLWREPGRNTHRDGTL